MTDSTLPPMAATAAGNQRCGCPDFSLSRRRFLSGVAAGTGVLAAGSLFDDAFRQVSYAAVPDGNVVVVLSMRGGSDGLSIVVPKNDHAFLSQWCQRRDSAGGGGRMRASCRCLDEYRWRFG